jgi:hypothetical protein
MPDITTWQGVAALFFANVQREYDELAKDSAEAIARLEAFNASYAELFAQAKKLGEEIDEDVAYAFREDAFDRIKESVGERASIWQKDNLGSAVHNTIVVIAPDYEDSEASDWHDGRWVTWLIHQDTGNGILARGIHGDVRDSLGNYGLHEWEFVVIENHPQAKLLNYIGVPDELPHGALDPFDLAVYELMIDYADLPEDKWLRADRWLYAARCPYCGSLEPYRDDLYPHQDWPRCPDCQGC